MKGKRDAIGSAERKEHKKDVRDNIRKTFHITKKCFTATLASDARYQQTDGRGCQLLELLSYNHKQKNLSFLAFAVTNQ